MFGPPGIAYVYLVYGMYDCLNVVVGPDDGPSAVLIRAVEPLDGLDRMREDRLTVVRRRRAGRSPVGQATARARLSTTPPHRLASGPGLVAAAFGIDTRLTGADLCAAGAPLRLERDLADASDSPVAAAIAASPRIGVAYAEAWADMPWRFTLRDSRSVSGPAAGR